MEKIEFEYYDEEEFFQFLSDLPAKDRAKLIAVIKNIEDFGLMEAQRQEWVKKLETNLYEIRSKQASNIQRAIYFQADKGRFIISHSFTKKTQKTPEREKDKARRRRKRFLDKEDIK